MQKICFTGSLILLFSLLMMACENQPKNRTDPLRKDRSLKAKFEPGDGKVILFVGQDLESIGGTDDYKDGYFDHFPAPGGFTQYTDFMTGFNSYSLVHKGLDGLTNLDDWGDGPESMAITVADSDFK